MKYLKNFLLPNKLKKKVLIFDKVSTRFYIFVWNFNLWTKDDSMSKRLKRANVVNKNQVLHFLKRHRLSTFHHLATKVIMSS